MSKEHTCKDCQAFIGDDEERVEGSMPGVCILNPPQSLVGNEVAVDGTLTEQIVMSAFPKVDGLYTRCMKLILLSGIIFLSSCAPRENLGGQSILGHAWNNFINNRPGTPEYNRTHIVCRTYNNGYGHVTECR